MKEFWKEQILAAPSEKGESALDGCFLSRPAFMLEKMAHQGGDVLTIDMHSERSLDEAP